MILDHPWAFGPLDQMSLFCHQICNLTSTTAHTTS